MLHPNDKKGHIFYIVRVEILITDVYEEHTVPYSGCIMVMTQETSCDSQNASLEKRCVVRTAAVTAAPAARSASPTKSQAPSHG
jgi:hypothetical protein